jgi:DNA polymerase-3 subunit beta
MSAPKINFSVTGFDALNSILPVASFVKPNAANVMLGFVYVKVSDDKLFCLAANGGQCIAKSISLTLQSVPDFEMCLDGAKLRSIIGSLKDAEKLTFSIEAETATISAGRSKLKCPAMSAATYPTPPRVGAETFSMKLGIEPLMQLLKRTKHAIAVSDPRFYLNGLNLVCADGMVTANATDGHRLSRYSVQGVGFEGQANVIIPKAMVDLLAGDKSLNQSKGSVMIRLDSYMIEVVWSSGMLRSQLIDAKFPDVTKFINTETILQATADRQAMFSSLSRIRGVADDSKVQTIKLENSQKELRLYSVDAQKELSGEDYVAGAVCEDDFTKPYSVNSVYLSDALSSFVEDDLLLSLSGNGMVLVSKSCPEKLELVLPMRD